MKKPVPDGATGDSPEPRRGGAEPRPKCKKCWGRGHYYSGQSTVDGPWPCEKCDGTGFVEDAAPDSSPAPQRGVADLIQQMRDWAQGLTASDADYLLPLIDRIEDAAPEPDDPEAPDRVIEDAAPDPSPAAGEPGAGAIDASGKMQRATASGAAQELRQHLEWRWKFGTCTLNQHEHALALLAKLEARLEAAEEMAGIVKKHRKTACLICGSASYECYGTCALAAFDAAGGDDG